MRRDSAAQDPANATGGDAAGANATAGGAAGAGGAGADAGGNATGGGEGGGGPVAKADQCKELIYTDCRATGGFAQAKPTCYGTKDSSWG